MKKVKFKTKHQRNKWISNARKRMSKIKFYRFEQLDNSLNTIYCVGFIHTK